MQKLKATIDTQRPSYKSIGSINNFDKLELELELKMNGSNIDFISPSFELISKKPDGTINRQIKNIVLEHGNIKIECDEEITIASKNGIVTNQLIIKDNCRISSYPFYFMIGSTLDSDVIQSITNVKALEELDEYVVIAIQKLSDFEAKLEELENNLGSGGSSSGVAGKDGKDGKSAYELAVENGFVGSLEEWLESLKGKDGEPGQPGRDGVDGVDGSDAVLSEEQVTALNSISEIKQNVENLNEQYVDIAKKVDNIESNSNGSVISIKDIFANNELPRIYMDSERLGLLTSKTDTEAICECEIKINNKTIKCYATGKVQGTTSATFPAKNFTFKFYSDKECSSKQKIDVGFGEQYKYCFKKNWVDTTHTRNLAGARIGFDMAESRPNSDFKANLQTAPRNGLVDGFPCKLYINGEFWGLYTWNIPKDDWMFNMDSDNPKHMVLCAERNNDGNMSVSYSTQFRKLWDGKDGDEWSIEVGTLSEQLKTSFNNAINFVMTSSDEEFKANISNYFDLYSLLDYYIFTYFTCHYDGLGKNMLIGTYDGIHWGTMLYDMDSIFGATYNGGSFMATNRACPSEYQESNSLLWQRIEKCFAKELYDRYTELRKGALSLGNVITHVEEIYDLIPDRVFNDEKAKWTALPSINTNTITRFRNYMRDRAKYVDNKFKEFNIEKVPCTSITLSSNTLEFTEYTTQTLTTTVTPTNTTDGIVWSVYPTGIISNSNGTIKPISNGECIITATCGSETATCNVSVNIEEEEEINETIVVLNGSEEWALIPWDTHLNSEFTPFEFNIGSLVEKCEYPKTSTSIPNFTSDDIPVIVHRNMYLKPQEAIAGTTYNSNKLLCLDISNSKLSSNTVEGLKEYLSKNNITIKFVKFKKIRQLESGSFDDYGVGITSNTEVRTVEFIPVETNCTNLMFEHSSSALDVAWFFDKDKNFIKLVSGTKKVAIPENAVYFKARFVTKDTNFEVLYYFE